MDRRFHVHILASRRDGTLYVGVTSDLAGRLDQHRSPSATSFTHRFNIHRLAHVETYADAETAIRRETRLKKWPRAWKVALFEGENPERLDRAAEWLG
jgi:putative endonuclease